MATLDAQDLHGIIGGALYDLLGRFTSLPKPIMLGSSQSPDRALTILQGWAEEQGLDLENSRVEDWHKALPEPPAKFEVKDANGEVVIAAPAQTRSVILGLTTSGSVPE